MDSAIFHIDRRSHMGVPPKVPRPGTCATKLWPVPAGIPALMNILHSYSPDVEQYSIDEAFVDMTGTEGL